MIALDTNVVVRYLTRDDAVQFRQASRVIDEHETFVAVTVILETEWVLRSSYRYSRSATRRAILGFLGLPGVVAQESTAVALALEWMEGGLDFADALHLAQCPEGIRFVTFDEALAKSGKVVGGPTVALLSDD